MCVHLQTEQTDWQLSSLFRSVRTGVGLRSLSDWRVLTSFLDFLCSAARALPGVSHQRGWRRVETLTGYKRVTPLPSHGFWKLLSVRRRNLHCTATDEASTSCFHFIDPFEYVFFNGTVLSLLDDSTCTQETLHAACLSARIKLQSTFLSDVVLIDTFA